jgi:hypothetical protein
MLKMSPDPNNSNDANIGSSGDTVVVSKAGNCLRNSAPLSRRVSARKAPRLPGRETTSKVQSVSRNREVQLVARNSTTEVEWS